MSCFTCEYCGTSLIDAPGGGYINECEHYKIEKQPRKPKKTDGIMLEFFDESRIRQAAKEGALSQRIQRMVWDYMDTPRLKRNGVELANAIIDDCRKTL